MDVDDSISVNRTMLYTFSFFFIFFPYSPLALTPLFPLFAVYFVQRLRGFLFFVRRKFDQHDIPYDVLWLDIEHTDSP